MNIPRDQIVSIADALHYPASLGMNPAPAIHPSLPRYTVAERLRLRAYGELDRVAASHIDALNTQIAALTEQRDHVITVGNEYAQACSALKTRESALKTLCTELIDALKDVISWVPGREAWHSDAPILATDRARTLITKAKEQLDQIKAATHPVRSEN